MKVVILSWNGGENDPFTVFAKSLKRQYEGIGKDVSILEISSESWIQDILNIKEFHGIDFTYTFQGIASDLTLDNGSNFWELNNIPLLCVHGDHPCHMPKNHVADNAYVRHVYISSEFSYYSNRYFRNKYGSRSVTPGLVHNELPIKQRSGNYFVFMKNIHNLELMKQEWSIINNIEIKKFLLECSALIEERINLGNHINHHQFIDDMISEKKLDLIFEKQNRNILHYLHDQLDFYFRTFISLHIVKTLKDFPIKIFGRGWDSIQGISSKHEINLGKSTSNSQELLYSRYGIIDVSPSYELHDRSLRAIANSTSFLSTAFLNKDIYGLNEELDIFINSDSEEVKYKCELITSAPERHLDKCLSFRNKYLKINNETYFINSIVF
jgi:superoxide dismutase